MTPHPPLEPVGVVVRALESAGLLPTLGGSGLLYAHGLVETANDWDLLVDADHRRVQAALMAAGFIFADGRADAAGQYGSAARLLISVDGDEVDLIVRFIIWSPPAGTDRRAIRIPSLPSGSWKGLPLGSLEAWLVAYRLMDRPLKPDRIHEHLARTGVDRGCLERMLTEPLPDAIRAELERLRQEGV